MLLCYCIVGQGCGEGKGFLECSIEDCQMDTVSGIHQSHQRPVSFERLGMWEKHLLAVSKFINLFAATGHIYTMLRVLGCIFRKCRNCLLLTHGLQQIHCGWLPYCEKESSPMVWTDLIIEQVLMRSLKSSGGLTRGRGMTESVRHQWVYTMHACAAIHGAMSTLTGKQHQRSEQHVYMGRARCNHDCRDVRKIMEWYVVHDLFDGTVPQLRSLVRGLTAREGGGINCDETEKVGELIKRSMDGKSVSEATMNRSLAIRTLDDLRSGINIDTQIVRIDPSVLFTRCTELAQREDDYILALHVEGG